MIVINSFLSRRPTNLPTRSFMHLSQFLLRGAFCLPMFAGILGAQSIAVLTGAQGASTSISVFTANPLAPQLTVSPVPAGAFQLYAKPDGSKYYVLTTSPGITILDRNFGNPQTLSLFN